MSLKQQLKYRLFVDLESYYDREDCSLRKLSVPEYIFHPKFQVHLLSAYDLTWPAPKIILPQELPKFLASYPPDETEAIAHNMLFDGSVLAWKYNWVPARLVDTLGMVRALRNYKKNSLGAVAEQLFGYNSKGDALGKVAGMTAQDIKNAGLWPAYCTYALGDSKIGMGIYAKLYPELPPEEREIMDLVLRCAIKPTLQADVPLLQTHLDELRQRKARLLRECGYEKAALMSTAQFKDALIELGVPIKTKISAAGNEVPAFAKSDPFMSELAEYNEADEETNYKVQTLAMARLSHKSTIEETRCQKFINIASLPWELAGPGENLDWSESKDLPLLPVPLRYGGALTHRLSGEWGMNLQNLPRDQRKSQLRSALKAPEGYKLISADLSQIEARIVAVLCEQENLIQEFKAGDVYSSFASRVFGRTITKKKDPAARFCGKTGILSLQYGSGAARFHQMVTTQARANNIPLQGLFDETVAQKTVNTYRTLYHKIPEAWRMLDDRLIHIINNPKEGPFATWGPVTFSSGRILLPNGMYLRYQVGEMDLYGAKILENCVGALTKVLTVNGWKPIVDLQPHELVFDGIDWVSHSGVVERSPAKTIEVNGVRMTPEHRVLTTDGWVRAAQTEGLHWSEVRLSDSATRRRDDRSEAFVEAPLHLRQDRSETDQRIPPATVLRLQEGRADWGKEYQAQDVGASSLLGVALNARPLSVTHTPSMEELRGAGDYSLHAMGPEFCDVLERDGTNISTGSNHRTSEQPQGLLQSELLLGKLRDSSPQSKNQSDYRNTMGSYDGVGSGKKIKSGGDDAALPDCKQLAFRKVVRKAKPPEPVYDIINCGPRQQFVVLGDRGPFIVHNCTQALARIVIMQSAVRLARQGLQVRFAESLMSWSSW